MTQQTEQWRLTREAVSPGGLSVIVPDARRDAVAAFLTERGVTAEVVATDPRRYRGRSAALKAAFAETHGEFVFVLDNDPDENIGQLPAFLAEMTLKGADIVIGSKRHPASVVNYPLRRRFLSWGYYTFVRLFIGLKVTDTQTGVKLFRRAHLQYALERMLEKSNAFDLEILTIAHEHGAKIAEAPVVVAVPKPDTTAFKSVSRRQARGMLNDTLAVFYRSRILRYYRKALVPKPLDHEPLVSVVIACPAPSWMLDECLAALAQQTYANFEVIVLPDGDVGRRSRSVRPAGRGQADVTYVPTGKVRPAEKRNLGIRLAKGEIVAFIDDDAYPEKHWLEYAVKYFGEPSIGALGGPAVTPPGDRKLAHVGGRVYENILVSGNYRYRYRAGGVRMDIEDYPSCNLFVRKDLLDAFGGYRTDFWPGEDTLLCKDILDNWKRIVYEPWVVVYHHRRPLFAPHLRQLGRYGFHRGYFCKRYPSNSLRLSYFVPTAFLFYTLAWAVLTALTLCGVLPRLAWCLSSVPLALYAALVAVTSFTVRPWTWFLTGLGVFASHLVYGAQFLLGLLARRAPCEYIGVDHASATAGA